MIKSSNLCPGCEEPVLDPGFEDAASRPWHRAHALSALADGFRTPLAPEDARRAVAFEHRGDRPLTAPHSFHLREIEFEDEAEVSGLFVGAYAMVYAGHEPLIRPKDLPGRRIVVDCDVPMGLQVSVSGTVGRYRLLGERRPEKERPKERPTSCLAVGRLRAEVEAGGSARTGFSMVAPFRGERLVVDDFEGWEIAAVRAGMDPGRAKAGPVRLGARSTEMPTYEVRVAEMLEFEVRNLGAEPRTFLGRMYGTMRWS